MSEKIDKMHHFDVAIAGGGIVGMSLALALSRLRKGALSVALIDQGQSLNEDRAFAFSAGARRFLDVLGVWGQILPEVQPLTQMVITDSRLNDPIRPVFLTFAHEVTQGEPVAYMISESAVLRALQVALDASVVHRIVARVDDANPDEAGTTFVLSNGQTHRASLVAACDGGRSPLREKAGIAWHSWSYKQSGIVTTIGLERDHEGIAEEHFLPSGPFALLPLTDNRFSIVWTESDDRVPSILAQGREHFREEVEKRAGHRFGRITVLSEPRAYPLRFGLAQKFGSKRLALVGDAAHLIHPIAGQGLNLGLRDVAALIEIICDQSGLGLDLGSSLVIEAYERSRRADTVEMATLTDALNRLFSNDAMPLRLMRDLGLGIVDRLPTLKSRLIREASAANPRLPRLMRGETLPGL